VSIEQKPVSLPTETTAVSAIENEIPTYRAISPHAVVSLVCGVLAVLSFAHWSFLAFAAAAVVLGVVADRRIQRLSDVLTGRGIAQAGIALGLIFGLASFTTTAVQDWIRVRESSKFAKHYANVLKDGTFEEAIWFGQVPFRREGKTPKELYDEIVKSKLDPTMLDMEQEQLKNLKKEVSENGADLDFLRIETHGNEKLTSYASALFAVHPAAGKPSHEDERFALVVIKGVTEKNKPEWWVESVIFPYKPASYTPPIAKADDGHGHAH